MTTNADRKLLALGVKGTEFTAKELGKALEYLLKAITGEIPPAQRPNYADFQQPGGVPLLNVSTQQQDIQGFAELSRQNDVNVSVKHNQGTGTYYLCLQGQLKDIEKSAIQYQKRIRGQTQTRTTVTASLEQAKTQTAVHAGKTQNREQNRGER